MDCGEMYNQRICKERLIFGSNTADIDLIPHIYIYNWEILGAGLYSQWRYLTHWEYGSLKDTLPQHLPWFILMLEQLRKSSASSTEDEY